MQITCFINYFRLNFFDTAGLWIPIYLLGCAMYPELELVLDKIRDESSKAKMDETEKKELL